LQPVRAGVLEASARVAGINFFYSAFAVCSGFSARVFPSSKTGLRAFGEAQQARSVATITLTAPQRPAALPLPARHLQECTKIY
jgi:hypothetical protein